MLALQTARLVEKKVEFRSSAGFYTALRDGCFYLEIPSDVDMAPLHTLARNFYLEKSAANSVHEENAYRGFKNIDDVYFDREHYQTEHILLQSADRKRSFPKPAIIVSDQMIEIARLCLKSVLSALNIPENEWDLITGGSTNGAGTEWFAVSHYRTNRDLLGCAPHQDTGFITVLFMDADGLEAVHAGGWSPIAARSGYFLINFGASFEHLTKNWKTPLKAIYHRVRKISPNENANDRISFAAFLNPPASASHYQINEHGDVYPTGSVEAFLREFNQKTWRDRHAEFGIA